MKILTYDIRKKKTVLCGELEGETFRREVNSRHFMRVVGGYGIQEDAFQKLCEKRAKKILIHVENTSTTWESVIEDWKINSKTMDFGNGKQRFLSLKYMKEVKNA